MKAFKLYNKKWIDVDQIIAISDVYEDIEFDAYGLKRVFHYFEIECMFKDSQIICRLNSPIYDVNEINKMGGNKILEDDNAVNLLKLEELKKSHAELMQIWKGA